MIGKKQSDIIRLAGERRSKMYIKTGKKLYEKTFIDGGNKMKKRTLLLVSVTMLVVLSGCGKNKVVDITPDKFESSNQQIPADTNVVGEESEHTIKYQVGPECYLVIDADSRVGKITGTGDMFVLSDQIEFNQVYDNASGERVYINNWIDHLVVEEGITSIETNSFVCGGFYKTFEIPSSVQSINLFEEADSYDTEVQYFVVKKGSYGEKWAKEQSKSGNQKYTLEDGIISGKGEGKTTWVYNIRDYTLTVNGSGITAITVGMSGSEILPYYISEEVEKLVISEGITDFIMNMDDIHCLIDISYPSTLKVFNGSSEFDRSER